MENESGLDRLLVAGSHCMVASFGRGDANRSIDADRAVEEGFQDNNDAKVSHGGQDTAKKTRYAQKGCAVAFAISLVLLFAAVLPAPRKGSVISAPTAGSGTLRTPYSTTTESWTPEEVAAFEYQNTPMHDPNLVYYSRVREQAAAEIANTEEEVRYITNQADIVEASAPQYVLLIRVLTQTSALAETKERWAALFDRFTLPSTVRAQVEFVETPADEVGVEAVPTRRLFALPVEPMDWMFVVTESTYVNLPRLVRRLFADIDPTKAVRKGLLLPVDDTVKEQVVAYAPLLEAGILLTRSGLAELWDSPQAKSCLNEDATVSSWSACLSVRASLSWTSLPGLNALNVQDLMRHSLEGTLFEDTDINRMYESVGGPVMGTARLPITFANMSTRSFNEQLAVDTHQGQIPKILHHIWSGPKANMGKETQEAAKACQKMHEEKGWEYMLWDDEKLKNLKGLPNLPQMQGNHKFVRHYVDTVRYYLLHQFGGVYIDMDAFCMRTFDPLLSYAQNKGADLLMNYESQRHKGRQVANGILVAAPASPVLSAFMLHLGHRLTRHPRVFDLESDSYIRAGRMTGPWVVTEVREQWESWVQDHLLVLSSTAFIPLYREGDEANLEHGSSDVFSLAKSQGSYTVQIYHSGALRKILTPPAKRINITTAAPHDDDISTADYPSKSTEASPKQSVLVVVAHPDDELLWGGEYLLSARDAGANVHIVATSTVNKDTSTRRGEFNNVTNALHMYGEFLNGTDSKNAKKLEDHIQRHIQEVVCGQTWDNIITHGPEGEYGHPQHQLVHDSVRNAVRFCCQSFDRLHVFEPHPIPGYSFGQDKWEVAKLYKSQDKVIEKFGNWKEKIVPLAEYNYRKASEDCVAGALESKSKTRKCRLHDMIGDLNDFDGMTPGVPEIFGGEFGGHGFGC